LSSEIHPILILGAGLTGLCASIQLRKDGIRHRILERSPRVGGLATTTEEAGYRFDRTGHLLHLRDPEVREWVLQLLGPHAWLEIDRKSVVYSNGVVTKYPFQANVYGLPKELAYRCVRDFVRAHFDQGPGQIVTFEDYCLRHFGEGISDAFMIPYNEKLFGVHPREITASWCDRFVPRPALEDVLGGALGVAGAELGYNAKFLYPRHGIGELSKALAERAAPVELEQDVSAIDWRRRRVRASGDEIPYDSIISSIPLDTLVQKLVDPPHEVRQAGLLLRATSLYYLDLALNTPAEKPWHWVYVPERSFPFYRVGCYSNFSPSMAPPGKASLYVELADRRPPVLSSVLPRIANDLVEIGMIRAAEAIRFARVRNIDRAYVLYDHEREGALEVIAPFLEQAGIMSVGRYGAWEYASMEDAIISGRDAACAAADALGAGGR